MAQTSPCRDLGQGPGAERTLAGTGLSPTTQQQQVRLPPGLLASAPSPSSPQQEEARGQTSGCKSCERNQLPAVFVLKNAG